MRKKLINRVFILKKASEGIDGKEAVKQNKYAAYVELNKDGAKLYGSDKSSIEGSIVEGMLTTFVDKYNVAAEVAKVDPSKVSAVISNGNHNDYIKETSLQAAKKARFYGLLCSCNDDDDCTICSDGSQFFNSRRTNT